MPKLRSRAALYLVAIAVTAACCYAQSVFSGNIQGVISDLTGAAIPSATIGLRNVDTGVTATATSSSSGNYRFSSLPPGNYVVSAELAGFRKAEIKVTLETNQTQGVNISMALATSTQTYNVTTEAPTLDTDENRMQATLTSQTVRDLPAL
ncbi:MAG TPA: carboxypeptidase-like regulatory domain-containing protein, partial [Bryobacteraceae bacterium]